MKGCECEGARQALGCGAFPSPALLCQAGSDAQARRPIWPGKDIFWLCSSTRRTEGTKSLQVSCTGFQL